MLIKLPRQLLEPPIHQMVIRVRAVAIFCYCKTHNCSCSITSRPSNRADQLDPRTWSVPLDSSNCCGLIVPTKVRESHDVIQPCGRRAGWKGLSVCAACLKSFPKMSELNQHYISKHKELLEREWTAALTKRQLRGCKATNRKQHLCDRPRAQKQPLVSADVSNRIPAPHPIEMRSQSRTEGMGKSSRKGHFCPWCNYCAKWPTELQKHMVVHDNSRPYSCIICSNCYKWSWDLGRHFSTVHAGLPNPYKLNKKSSRIQIRRSI
ncbi:unnamed protein product [Mesocestoides corti]|uniref:C2H2-type domain-containing protein n=1 Tax=Mesocestoides corti TaxID=53468 RepID=A0A158QUH5_MESCO|nr:unnamed protein product [Mesocestoides corti]